jgi:hypothetical protein
MATNAISGNQLLKQVCEKIDVDFNTVRRVVLDISYNAVVTVYIEKIGTTKLLDIDMQSNGIKIKEVGA